MVYMYVQPNLSVQTEGTKSFMVLKFALGSVKFFVLFWAFSGFYPSLSVKRLLCTVGVFNIF